LFTRISCVLLFIFGSLVLQAQILPEAVQVTKDTTQKASHRLILLPILFFTPETQTALGFGGVLTFHLKGDSASTRASNFQFGGIYTQLDQYAIYIPYQLYFKNELFNVYGEASYYRFNYNFYGIGPSPPPLQEKYELTFPHARITALRRITNKLYGGVLYEMDADRITHLDSVGLLHLHKITGSNGGLVSTMGLTLKFDSRDDNFYPTRGYYAEFCAESNEKWTGSSFHYTRYALDMSTYYTTPFHHTLAANFYSALENGDPPFYQMSLIGGAKKMRGFYEGRFRDNDLALIQGEYRAPLFWRIGSAAFVSAGYVADKVQDIHVKDVYVAYGVGLRYRLDRKQKVNIRVDYGLTNINEQNLYITLSEAF
jgi:outer membrane protein assembly factor BamA